MRVPDNLDFFEMHEREEERKSRRLKRLNQLELEEELGFRTVDEMNEEREED